MFHTSECSLRDENFRIHKLENFVWGKSYHSFIHTAIYVDVQSVRIHLKVSPSVISFHDEESDVHFTYIKYNKCIVYVINNDDDQDERTIRTTRKTATKT